MVSDVSRLPGQLLGPSLPAFSSPDPFSATQYHQVQPRPHNETHKNSPNSAWKTPSATNFLFLEIWAAMMSTLREGEVEAKRGDGLEGREGDFQTGETVRAGWRGRVVLVDSVARPECDRCEASVAGCRIESSGEDRTG